MAERRNRWQFAHAIFKREETNWDGELLRVWMVTGKRGGWKEWEKESSASMRPLLFSVLSCVIPSLLFNQHAFAWFSIVICSYSLFCLWSCLILPPLLQSHHWLLSLASTEEEGAEGREGSRERREGGTEEEREEKRAEQNHKTDEWEREINEFMWVRHTRVCVWIWREKEGLCVCVSIKRLRERGRKRGCWCSSHYQ